MGTDIVTAIEYQEPDSDCWAFIAEVAIERDYLLFAIIAGVRNSFDVKPIVVERRGHPDDMSPDTKYVMDGSDQSKTWLVMSEVLEVIEMYKGLGLSLGRGCNLMSISIISHIMWDCEINGNTSRLVIAFN